MSAYREALQRAWDRRAPWVDRAAAEGTDAYRLFTGEAEGIPGVVAERFASVVILQLHEGKQALPPGAIEQIAHWYLGRDGVRSVYLKRFVPDRSGVTAEGSLRDPRPCAGEAAPAEVLIRENGIRFRIRPYDGFSTGIFLDQRGNRRFLAARAQGRTVLNCFAYTCAFSVYAASGGGRTTSVDLSAKALDWGKANFSSNGIDLAHQRFFATDVFRFFKSAGKRDERYGLVILDPPSFSRNREGDTFSIQRDLGELIRLAAERVESGGEIFLSTNHSAWDHGRLRELAAEIWRDRHPRFVTLPPVAADYAPGPSPIACVLAGLR